MIFFTFSLPVRGNEAEEREIRISADSKMNGLFYQQLKRVTPNWLCFQINTERTQGPNFRGRQLAAFWFGVPRASVYHSMWEYPWWNSRLFLLGCLSACFSQTRWKGWFFPQERLHIETWEREISFAVSSQWGIKLREVYVQNIFPPVSLCSAVNQQGWSHARHLKVVILKPFCTPVVLLSIYPPSSLFLSISLSLSAPQWGFECISDSGQRSILERWGLFFPPRAACVSGVVCPPGDCHVACAVGCHCGAPIPPLR